MPSPGSDPDIPWPIRYALSKIDTRLTDIEHTVDRIEPVVNKLAEKDAIENAITNSLTNIGANKWSRNEKILGVLVAISAATSAVGTMIQALMK